MKSNQLKSLQTKRVSLLKSIETKEAEIESAKQKLLELRAEVNSVEQQIKEMQDAAPIVSEHARLRYLERVKGINMQEIDDEILSAGAMEHIRDFPNGRFEIGGKFVAIVKDKTVVTIKEKGQPKKPVKRGTSDVDWVKEYETECIDAN